MKILFGLIALFTVTDCLGQTFTPNQSTTAAQMDTLSPGVCLKYFKWKMIL